MENGEAPQAPPPFKRKFAAFRAPSFVNKPAASANAAGGSKPAAAPVVAGGSKPAAPAAKLAPTKPAAAKPAVAPAAGAQYFVVLYAKYQPGKKLRKNKVFADGVLEIKEGSKAVLHDSEGKTVAQTTLRGYGAIGEGSQVIVGSWELEVDSVLDGDKFRTGEAFLKPTGAAAVAAAALPVPGKAVFKPFRPMAAGGGGAAAPRAPAPPPAPLHDPQAEGAMLLNEQQWAGGAGKDGQGRPVVAVVVDPFLGRHLRPHQVEGVRFMYECAMGLRSPTHLGAILADAMGLGKTIQVLALVWTLLKQGPLGRPAVRKVCVVTPSSLCQNWAEEARKWLGPERLPTLVLGPGPDGASTVNDFRHGAVHRVLITSYETVRKHAPALAGAVDLLVCDEGHRLKAAAGNKTIAALLSLGCPRRVLLTGTPVQNNLKELYAMVDFCNPDLLGTLPVFERVFGAPITRSRDRTATAEEMALGQERSGELSRRLAAMVLRRTAEVNAKYLPPCDLFVVFCRPTPLQLRCYSAVLGSTSVRSLLTSSNVGDQALSVLDKLRKICNHPCLCPDVLAETEYARGADDDGPAAAAAASDASNPLNSGKLAALAALLEAAIGELGERVVVVSQSTAALDLAQAMCEGRGWGTARLDGGTDVSKRQDLVNTFNRFSTVPVFLLSTTAGGAGLNLTGANRLVLLDSHWNPACDAQAMARVWRDGQAKPCVLYRLLTTGTIDEKMYQRQRAKGDVAATMLGAEGGARPAAGKQPQLAGGQFSAQELRQLFTLRTDTACDTAELLTAQAGGSSAADAFVDASGACADPPLRAALGAGHVTFVRHEKMHAGAAAAIAAAAAAVAEEEEAGGEEAEAAGRESGADDLELDEAA